MKCMPVLLYFCYVYSCWPWMSRQDFYFCFCPQHTPKRPQLQMALYIKMSVKRLYLKSGFMTCTFDGLCIFVSCTQRLKFPILHSLALIWVVSERLMRILVFSWMVFPILSSVNHCGLLQSTVINFAVDLQGHWYRRHCCISSACSFVSLPLRLIHTKNDNCKVNCISVRLHQKILTFCL